MRLTRQNKIAKKALTPVAPTHGSSDIEFVIVGAEILRLSFRVYLPPIPMSLIAPAAWCTLPHRELKSEGS